MKSKKPAAPQSSPLPCVCHTERRIRLGNIHSGPCDPSPLPNDWYVHQSPDAPGRSFICIPRVDNNVAEVFGKDAKERKARAVLIVRRVNQAPAFDAMEKALDRLAETSQWSVSSGVNETAQMRANFNHAIEAAHAALKLAQEAK